jgi:hypothetical protein
MAGVIVGIEMSRKDPRRVSKLAGRPHLHVFGYIQRLSATVTF